MACKTKKGMKKAELQDKLVKLFSKKKGK